MVAIQPGPPMAATPEPDDSEQIPCQYGCGQSFHPRGLPVHEISCVRNPDRRPHSRSSEYAAWAEANGRPESGNGDTVNQVVNVVQRLPGEVTPQQVKRELPDMPMHRVSYGLIHAAKRRLIGNPARGVYTAKPDDAKISNEEVVVAIEEHYGPGQRFRVSDLYERMGRPGPRHDLANRMLFLRNKGVVGTPERGVYVFIGRTNGAVPGRNSPAPPSIATAPEVSERPSVRDVRAKLANNQRVGVMLAQLVGIEPDEASLLIEWIDLTRELVGRGK